METVKTMNKLFDHFLKEEGIMESVTRKRGRKRRTTRRNYFEVVGILPRGLVLRKLRRLEDQAEGAMRNAFVIGMRGGTMSWR